MGRTRLQLTLFLHGQAPVIEEIRVRYNPLQAQLIAAHVTLCREDELAQLELIKDNLSRLQLPWPLVIHFGPPQRFNQGKGVLLTAVGDLTDFAHLRRLVLAGTNSAPREHQAHLTLMHPRNSACTDEIFAQLLNYTFPSALTFSRVCLIIQTDQQPWKPLDEFSLI